MALFKRFAAVACALAALGIAGCGSGSKLIPDSPTQGSIEGYIFGRSPSKLETKQLSTSRLVEPPAGTTPINDATITLTPSGRQTTTTVDRSGQGGYFKITGLDAGTYTAKVQHDGYREGTFTVNVMARTTTLAGVDNGKTTLEPSSGVGRKKWTVMVYMDADGDLEEFGILNINQMEQIGSDANVNIVVQCDRGPGFDATNGDWTDTRRYLITKDSDMQTITSPVLENMGEVDMGQPESLSSFITWASTTYPADHYALVLWNHGAGWRSRNLPNTPASRGIIFDDTSNTYLTMGELRTGMTTPGVHFDLTAIDCSLMGMIEVAYEIKDQTDYITASEESPPGPGYPYHKILGRLAANPAMSTEAFGRAFVEEQIANYSRDAVTQSLIQTARLEAFAQKVNAFGAALIPTLTANQTEFNLARTRTQSYAFSYYRDIYDFAQNAKSAIPNAAVSSAADAVMQGMPGANGGPIIAEGHNLASMQNSHGLSIYLPSESQFFSGYSDLRLSQEYPKWNQLVRGIAAPL